MNMGVCGGDQAQLVAGGEVDVAIHVPLGIDDDGLTRSRTAN
jgi:hypothetical protein